MQIIADKLWVIHKYHISQEYGGPEEGGWWYDGYYPLDDSDSWVPLIFTEEEEAYDKCRELNGAEYDRRESQPYGYNSVLSHQCEFYTYSVENTLEPGEFTTVRPYYE